MSRTYQPSLSVRGANKVFATKHGTLQALEDVDLHVEPGELVSLVGPSGCGKSTLLWAIAGLHELSSGSIEVGGEAVNGPNQHLGLIFQESNLLPWRTLLENIKLPFEIMGRKPDMDAIRDFLGVTGLTGFEDHYPKELSGGMQQRASIVRALSYGPDMLLLDEPFAALDAFTRDEMNLMLLDVWERTHKTILFVTHQIPEAVFLSDRIYVLKPRPGRNSAVFDVDLPRPRKLEMTTETDFFEIVSAVKNQIYDDAREFAGEDSKAVAQSAGVA